MSINQLKERALHDMWAFCDLIDFHGGVVSFDAFHREMSLHYTESLKPDVLTKLKNNPELLQNTPSTFVNLVPRGYLKSTVNTVLFVLWRIYRNPNIRISINTNNQVLAYSFIRELRSYLEDVELVERVWDARVHIPGKLIPNLKTTKLARGASRDDTEAADNKLIWNNVALQVLRTQKLKEPTVAIGSANSINTGNHYDLVIFDDVVDFANSRTLDSREKLRRWMNEVESQLDPTCIVEVEGTTKPLLDFVGQKMINGTLYYDEDLYSTFTKRSQANPRISVFLRNIYKNGVDDKDGYNWESRFNKHTIADIKERIDDPAVFAAQYELMTLEQFSEKSSERRNIVEIKRKPDISAGEGLVTLEYEGTVYRVPLFGAMDVAQKHDFNVLIIGAYLKPELFCVVDVIVQRGSLDRFLKDSYHLVQDVYPVRVCYVEANGVGGGVKTAMSFLHKQANPSGFKPLKFTEIWQTESKAVRIAFAQRYMQDNCVLCTGAVGHNSTFVKQLKSYTEYDDVPDCLATALYRFPKNYYYHVPGERKQQYQVDSEKRVLRTKLRNLYEMAMAPSKTTKRGIIDGHF